MVSDSQVARSLQNISTAREQLIEQRVEQFVRISSCSFTRLGEASFRLEFKLESKLHTVHACPETLFSLLGPADEA